RRPSDFSEHDWLKIGYAHLDEDDRVYGREQLRELQELEVSNSTPMNCEVNENGGNKGERLRTFCKKLNITLDEEMAVGDSLNDFKMINEVGIRIAMGNAQEEILEIADYVTLTNREDGVAEAIKKYALDK